VSGERPIPQARESAHEVRLHAARWMQRRQLWDWSEEDQAELDRWLAQSPSHHVAYMRVMAVWNRTERLTALRGAPATDETGAPRRGWSLVLRSAAAIALVSALGLGGYRYFQVQHQTTWTTPVGGHEILTLGDGSKIELNTNTVLRVSADQRSAWLDRGEAYFQIRHDGAHPFSVTAAGKRVVDIGTKFLVRRDTGELEVALVEGKARIEPAKPRDKAARSAILTRGDVALATGDSLSIVKVPQARLLRELSWRQDLLVFDNARLADVAAELNRYNREQLVVDPSVADLKIVASIPTNGIQAFKRVARDFLGLRVEERGRDIVIAR